MRKTAPPPWPYSGFITMSPCSARNALISARSRVISVGGISSGNWVTNTFSGALRTWPGSLTTSVAGGGGWGGGVADQRGGWEAVEQVRCRDVGEVERRILAHQDHVERFQRDAPFLSQGEMVPHVVAHRQRPHGGEDLAAALRHAVG